MKYTITGDISRQAIHKAVDSAQIGEVVNLRESTAAMSKKRFSSLVDYVIAYCVENDVKISARID